MRFKGIRVLVLEGYARQSLPLIKAFNKLECNVSVLCNSKLDVAYHSRYTNHKILGICDREKIEETTEQIRELLKSGMYDVVVPTVDFSASLLSQNKIEFERYAKIVSNNPDVYSVASDKLKTMEICMQNNIPCPITIVHATSVDEVMNSGIKFPIVIKPRTGYGAIGFHKIDSKEELVQIFKEKKGSISEYMFQEYIPQTALQYECAVFMDNQNEAKTSLVFSKNRWYPLQGGSSTLNITVDYPEVAENCAKLLKYINWRGPADIDLIQDPRDGKAKVMEINPRVSGSVKICFISGVDQARQMLELVYNQPVTEYKRYELGKRLRCFQTDMLWFIKSSERFKSKPSWFSWKNTSEHTFSWDDPIPWLFFSIGGLINYKREMDKRR